MTPAVPFICGLPQKYSQEAIVELPRGRERRGRAELRFRCCWRAADAHYPRGVRASRQRSTGMNSVGEIFLIDRSPDRVFWVDEVPELCLADLAEQHVGVIAVEAEFLLHPEDQIAIGDAHRVLQRAGGADRHDEFLALQPWPGEGPAFQELDTDRHHRRMF